MLTAAPESQFAAACLAAQASARAMLTSSRSLSLISLREKWRLNVSRQPGKIRRLWLSASLAAKREARHAQRSCRPNGDGRSPNELLRPVGTMTAEIAILNRRAVALSADSAVTISQTGKIYNSADKIFELSTAVPLGLMVYNSLDYMGIPLDVVIKSFRDRKGADGSFSNVFDVASTFFEISEK
jgi:hypothetical protein